MENMAMINLKETYSGKKIFLTGHTGFKGSWFLSWLSELGCVVKGYSLPPPKEDSLYNLINGEAKCESIYGDIRNYENLKKEILVFQPDFIFHFAAQALVIDSYKNPLDTYMTNVMGTANLLNVVRFLEKDCSIILITTDKVYENKEWIYPYRETDRLGGYDPYSSSKAASEIVISSFRSSFFNLNEVKKNKKGIAIARAGNVIGGGDWSENRLIPDIVNSIISDKPVEIRNPMSIRPWQHVLEPLYGYLLLGQHLSQNPEKYSDSFNFGPELQDSLEVIEVFKIASKIWGKGKMIKKDFTDALHEAKTLKLDISKSKKELGWEPKWTAHQAIYETVEWYKKFIEGKDITIPQLKKFIE